MTAGTIDQVIAAAELELIDDLLIEIDDDGSLAGRGLDGSTWPDGSRVTLDPDAFDAAEQLLRTLVHELVHVRQVRNDGPTTNSVMLATREREAYEEQDTRWQSYLERP